jgi:hypothetical protein
LNTFQCSCPSNYSYGSNCEILINNPNKCDINPCRNGGECIRNNNNYVCVCTSSFTGKYCDIVVNRCASSPCYNGGTCRNTLNEYSCLCLPDFTGSNCDIFIQTTTTTTPTTTTPNYSPQYLNVYGTLNKIDLIKYKSIILSEWSRKNPSCNFSYFFQRLKLKIIFKFFFKKKCH